MKKAVSRKLIIDGTAVYEIAEECMLKKRLDVEKKEKQNAGEGSLRENTERQRRDGENYR